jgi:flagellar basal-body rod modification protein FlgD
MTEGVMLGKDDYLRLLTTELKNQNPLEPLESKDFVAQLATFSQLEQLITLNEKFADYISISEKASVLSILGKEVTANIDDETVTGTAVGISYEDGLPTVTIVYNGTEMDIDWSNIIKVKEV